MTKHSVLLNGVRTTAKVLKRRNNEVAQYEINGETWYRILKFGDVFECYIIENGKIKNYLTATIKKA